MRGIHVLSLAAVASLLPIIPTFAAPVDQPVADGAKDKMICKQTQRTGTRFYTKVCKTAGQWEALAEQHKRDAREMVDRPQVEIRRE
jgi:hypothetical protein